MKTKKNKIKKLGGRAIESGGYGCVFKPALKCKDEEREPNQISKLMLKRNAKTEYDDIVKFLPYLKKIPDYEKYFLVYDITTCKPGRLDEEDLEGFDEKCSSLTKRKIKKDTVNEEENLRTLSIVNMPYGGVDVGRVIEQVFSKDRIDYAKLVELNNKLLELLKNGILPMNQKQHIYHCDLKDSNIIVDQEMNTRLIDWGLSCKYDDESTVPDILKRRPFQYNVPFSNVLFNNMFEDSYKEFLTKNNAPTYFETREFVVNYVFKWIDERGPGHLKSINSIIKFLFENARWGPRPPKARGVYFFFLNQFNGLIFSPKFSTFSLTNQPAAKPRMNAIVSIVFSCCCRNIYGFTSPVSAVVFQDPGSAGSIGGSW